MRIKEKNKQSKRRLFPLPLYVYLIYFMVCTLLLTGISFSGYVSTSAGSDSASAAAGLVTVSYDENSTKLNMIRPSNDGVLVENFTFDVSNNISEVAIRYDVVVTLNQPLRNGVTMRLDGVECSGNTNNMYKFSNIGTFEAGVKKTNTHTLSFAGDFDTISPGTDDTYDIQIKINSQQID